VERPGSEKREARVHDGVFWRDWLETDPRGRARLTLLDGSLVNVGSGARLQVVEHDESSQVTALELQVGKIRAQVKKIVQPNGRFEIRTDVAVVGVIGSHIFADRQEAKTVAINLDATGQAQVRNADRSVAGEEVLELFELAEVEPARRPRKRWATLEEIVEALEATLPGPVIELYPQQGRAGMCVPGLSSVPLPNRTRLPFAEVSVRACAAADITPTEICVASDMPAGGYEYRLAGVDGTARWGAFVVPPAPSDPVVEAKFIVPPSAPPGSTVHARLVRNGQPLSSIPVTITVGGKTTRGETDAHGSLPVEIPDSGMVEIKANRRAFASAENPLEPFPSARIVADPDFKPPELRIPDFAQVGSPISLPGELKAVRLGDRPLPLAQTTTPSGQIWSSFQLPGDLPHGASRLQLERPDGRTEQPLLVVYDVLAARLDQQKLISGNLTQGEFLVCVGSTDTKQIRARIQAAGPVRFRGQGGKGKLFEHSFPVAANGLVRIPFSIQAEKTGTSAGIPFHLSLELGRD
jgi:hypothetical protein